MNSAPGPVPSANVVALPSSTNSTNSAGQDARAENRPPPAQPEADAFRHGRSIAGDPRTWAGRVVSLDEWRGLSAWDRHGPDGRLWCGICRAWVSTFPDCHGGGS